MCLIENFLREVEPTSVTACLVFMVIFVKLKPVSASQALVALANVLEASTVTPATVLLSSQVSLGS